MEKEKPEKILSELFDDNRDGSRKIMERVWFRNILYYCGEQYLEWVVNGNTFRRRQVPDHIPTPVHNIIRDYVRAMKALLLNRDYTIQVWPNSMEQSDKQAAELAESLLRHQDSDEELDFIDEVEKASLWMLLTGTGFLRTYPYRDGGDWFIDKSGNFQHTGEIANEAIMPFNVCFSANGDRISRKKRIGIKSLKSREWVEDTFRTKVESGGQSGVVSYQKRLMKLVGNVSPWKGSGLESASFDLEDEDLVLFQEVEELPSRAFPNGRYIVGCGGKKIMDLDRLPIPAEDGKAYYTLTDFHYQYVPGRFWSDTSLNDLISPQNSINSILQQLEMNRRGIGRPVILTPDSLSMKRINKDGQSFIAIEYDATMTGGQKPEIHHGTPLPSQVLQEFEFHKAGSQETAGDPKHILRGKAPVSQASGTLVDLLRSAAEQTHAPDTNRFFRSLKRVYKKRLVLAKHVYTESRILKIAGPGQELKIRNFKGSDLRNNTDVRLEFASGIATTKTGQANLVLRLVETGGFLFTNMAQDPDFQQEIVRRLGLGDFKSRDQRDRKRAEEENARMASGEIEDLMLTVQAPDGEREVLNLDPLFKLDNHEVHFPIHRNFILSDEFQSLDPKIQDAALSHIDTHNAVIRENQQAQMMMQQQQQQTENTGVSLSGRLADTSGTAASGAPGTVTV